MQNIFFIIALITIAVQIVLRAGIVMGKPWSNAVFAEPFENWRIYCIIAIAGYAVLTLALLCFMRILPYGEDSTVAGIIVASIALVSMDVLRTVFSPNKKERMLMGPLNLLLAVSLIITLFSY